VGYDRRTYFRHGTDPGIGGNGGSRLGGGVSRPPGRRAAISAFSVAPCRLLKAAQAAKLLAFGGNERMFIASPCFPPVRDGLWLAAAADGAGGSSD
jgi:hypothetical protein